MDARVAPLLLRGPRTVPCSPGRHSAIIGFLDIREGHSRRCRLLFEALCLREKAIPSERVLGRLCFNTLVRLEAPVGGGVLPAFRAEFLNFGFALGPLCTR